MTWMMRLLREFADSSNGADKIEKGLRLTKQVDALATVGMRCSISEDGQEPRLISRRTVMVGMVGLTLIAGAGITGWALSPHPLYTYRGHSNYVYGVAWSPNGKRIASASGDTTVQVWEAA